jgi:hypothetical protein
MTPESVDSSQDDPVLGDGELLYRTPVSIKMAVLLIALLVISAMEAILQTMSFIPWYLQGALAALGIALFGCFFASFSAFLSIRVGSGWISTHRLGWRRVDTRHVRSYHVQGPSPRFCSITIRDQAGAYVFIGALAARDERVRAAIRDGARNAFHSEAVKATMPACLALGIDPSTLRVVTDAPKRRPLLLPIVTLVVGVGLGSAVRLRAALNDSWGSPLAIGGVFALCSIGFLWWVTGPSRWPYYEAGGGPAGGA